MLPAWEETSYAYTTISELVAAGYYRYRDLHGYGVTPNTCELIVCLEHVQAGSLMRHTLQSSASDAP